MAIHQRLIRRFVQQQDLTRLVASGMHLETGNPYFRGACEWGLMLDQIDLTHEENQRRLRHLFKWARTGNGPHGPNALSVVPGIRLILGLGGYAPRGPLPNEEEWENLRVGLEFITDPHLGLCDRTNRVILELENFTGGGEEVATKNLTHQERRNQDDWSGPFMQLIKDRKLKPWVILASLEGYLSQRIFEATDGHGCAMLEGFNQAEQLEMYLSNYPTFLERRMNQYVLPTVGLKRHMPNVLVTWQTSDLVLRADTTPWVDRKYGERDIVQSTDDLSWVYDTYRAIDTNEGDVSEQLDQADGPKLWNEWYWRIGDPPGSPVLQPFVHYKRALGSRAHFTKQYKLKKHLSIGVIHAWQFNGYEQGIQETDDLGQVTGFHDRAAISKYGFTDMSDESVVRRRMTAAFYGNGINAEGGWIHEEDQSQLLAPTAQPISRRGRFARYCPLVLPDGRTDRNVNAEPCITVPMGLDILNEWSACLTICPHGNEHGADGHTPWTRGMLLLNQWKFTQPYWLFSTQLYKDPVLGVARLRVLVSGLRKRETGVGTEPYVHELFLTDMEGRIRMDAQQKMKVLVSMKKDSVFWTWRLAMMQETPLGGFAPLSTGMVAKDFRFDILEFAPSTPVEHTPSNASTHQFLHPPPPGAGAPYSAHIQHHLQLGRLAGSANYYDDLSMKMAATRVGNGGSFAHLADGMNKSAVQFGSLYGVEVLDLTAWEAFGPFIGAGTDKNGALVEDTWPFSSWRITESATQGVIGTENVIL